MAVNLSELKGRIKATGNVAKLTGVMKMVASAKLKGAETMLEAGRPFGKALLDSVALDNETFKAQAAAKLEAGQKMKQLIVAVTTDRGLCGSVNSSLSRMLGPYIHDQQKNGFDVSVFVLGDKGRAQIAREHPDETVRVIDSAFDREPIFATAAAVGEMIVKEDFDVLTMVYNEYHSAAKFETTMKHIPQFAGLGVGIMPPSFKGYDVEPSNNEEALVNMMEFAVAGGLYYELLETQACEVSQRVTAMDNASTNAGDMVDRLTLLYNRARQAKITTELTEIISGAESLEDGE
jgi:F-type H+-transporting ATPase subunit gamma